MAKSRDKKRADELVFAQGLAETRNKAQALIMASKIQWINGEKLETVKKPGQQFSVDVQFQISGAVDNDVSRGAKKLRGALLDWPEIKKQISSGQCLDIGASTGGFTQVLLECGAKKVLDVDVGTHQLHERIRRDPRVYCVEKQHVLKIDDTFWRETKIDPFFEVIVTDVSFISVTKLVDFVASCLKPGASWLVLVKPQFELDASKAPGGIVKEELYRKMALENVLDKIAENATLEVVASADSKLAGVKGNLEFFLWVKKQ